MGIQQRLSGDYRWYNVELIVEKADRFKDWLREQNIYFEPSSAGNLIHFECLMTLIQRDRTNEFLKELEEWRP